MQVKMNFAATCTDAGYPVMAPVYEALAAYGEYPEVADVDPPAIYADHEAIIAAKVDPTNVVAAAAVVAENIVCQRDPHTYGKTLATFEDEHVYARLSFAETTGEHVVWWTDGVANDWRETYTQVSTAYGRWAMLLAAVADADYENGTGAKWFRQTDAATFVPAWEAALPTFLDES